MSASDPDGDSQMRSSSSDEADSEAMFPAELDPPGSNSQSHLNTLLPQQSEVTPPQSQDQGEAMDTGAVQENPVGQNDMGLWDEESAGNGGWVPESDFAKSAADGQHEPGAGWMNKKARDDYQRAAMLIEDKNFSLKEFGDPFDDSPQDQSNENN